MIGTAFIVGVNSWACSNDVSIDMQSTPIRGMDGKIVSIHKTKVFRAIGLFGNLEADEAVDIAMKIEGTNTIIGFAGRVKSIGQLTIINILNENNNIREILTKIT